MTVAFAFANVYCGCSRLYSLLDVFVYICSCFIQTWVEQCVSVADNNDTTEHPHLDTTRPYLCTMCRKRYRSRQNLNMRSKTHTGEDMFSCSQCEKRFFISEWPVSPYEYSYRFTECGRCCHTRHHLAVHLQSHSGEKPFEYTVCSK